MNTNLQRALHSKISVFGLVGMMALSGCLFKKDSHNNAHTAQESLNVNPKEVLLEIDGKPVLTIADYEAQLQAVRQSHQDLDMLLQMMPNLEREYIFNNIVSGKILAEWAERTGITQSPEFIKQKQQMLDAMNLNLCMAAFSEKYPVHVSDADVKAYFEEKKDVIPGLALSQAGVQVSYVRFDSKSKAEAFIATVSDIKNVEKLKQAAESQKLQLAEAVINENSPYADAVKKAVLTVKSYPKLELIAVSDSAYWVVFVMGKVDAKYRDYKSPEVQNGLREQIAMERKQKQLEEFIEGLKKDYKVDVKTGYFDEKERSMKDKLAAMNPAEADEAADFEDSHDFADELSESHL